MGRVKRVKFMNTETSNPQNCNVDTSHRGHQLHGSQRTIVPKTSEYAFFCNFKKGKLPDSFPLNRRKRPLKDTESDTHSGEFPTTDRVFHRDPCSETERPKPVKRYSLLPSTGVGSRKLENFSNGKGVFAEKRRKLRQYVVDCLCLEDDMLRSNEFNLVSVLLGRLLPERSEQNLNGILLPWGTGSGTRHQLPTTDYGTHVKGVYLTRPQKFKEAHKSLWKEDDFSIHRSNILEEEVRPQWHAMAMSLPLENYVKDDTYSLHKSRYFGSDLVGSEIDILFEKDDLYPQSWFKKYGSIAWRNVEFGSRLKVASRRGPLDHLLHGDYDGKDYEQDLVMTPDTKVINLYSKMGVLPNYSQPQRSDNLLDSSSSILTNYFLEDNWLPCISYSSFNASDFGVYHQDENDVEELERLPITLPNIPKFVNPLLGCNIDNDPKGRSIISSHQDHHLFTREVLCERHCIDSEFFPLSGGSLNLMPKFLPWNTGLQFLQSSYKSPYLFQDEDS